MSKQNYSLDRALPSDPEAERSVLGAILLDKRIPNECLLQASNKLKVSDFSLDSHRRIYQAMLELGAKEKPIDFVVLTDALTEKKALEAVGGVQYVTGITDGIPRVKNIEHYCDILIAHSTRRQVIHSCSLAMQSAYEQSDSAAELTDTLQVAADGIRNRTHAQTCVHVSQIGPKLCQRLIADYDSRGSTIGLPTGIGRLDFALGGLVKGENIVVAGYTGGGKTAFALNVVERNCSNDIPVTYYSFEVDRETLLIRLAAKRRGIPQIKLRTKTASHDELLQILDEVSEISRWPFWVDDRSAVTPRELYASARMQAARGVRLFVTDHIHIFANNCKGHTIREQVNEASGTIRAMAKDSGVPVLNLCQLSRPEDKRSPQKPTMYHLRESGALEQDAHSVVLLWRERDEDSRENGGYTGNDAIIIGKNRSGPVLEIAATYHGDLMYWKESNPYAPPNYGSYGDGYQERITQ